MGPYEPAQPHEHAPHPELSALRWLDAYAKHFGLTITAARGDWTVTGGGLEEPAKLPSYVELVVYLARQFGWPTLNRYGNPVERWKDGLTPGMQASARESFDTGWAGVTPRARFYVFVAVAIGELIAAAICFGK